jgi:NAD-dependent dihydropyrimidine dehydrogenase PreA subunit
MAIERIDYEKCTGCGICKRVCSVDVIRMDEESNKAVIKYPQECMLCEMCLIECPTGAIIFTPQKIMPLMVSHA